MAATTAALSLSALVLARFNGQAFGAFLEGNQANTWLSGLAAGLVGAMVLHTRARNRLGPVFAVVGLLAAVSSAATEYARYAVETRPGSLPAADFVAWCGATLWLPSFLGLITGVPLLFPDGRLASRGWRWPARVAAAASTVAFLSIATTEYIVDDELPQATNPFDLPWPDRPQVAVTLVCFFLALGIGVVATFAVTLRMRSSGYPKRQQQAWFVAGVLVTLAASELPAPTLVGFVGHALGIVAFGIGIARYQLFDIELALSRAVVYGLLTAASLASYLAASWLLGSALDRGSPAGVVPALVAAITALALATARQRVQRTVDRALYGDRSDPLGALTGLGEQLSQAMNSESVLPAIVDTVRRTLRLPYAAIQLANEPAPACSSGEPPAGTATFPLAHAGNEVGVLVVGLRRGETDLAGADLQLLSAFAQQIGVAALGVRVTRDLRRSRERLVLAREEERRRLRRDLHDGVGPALAGIALGLETASRAAEREASSISELLVALHRETTACLDCVRQVAADLRPPALDQIGLVAALRQQADLLGNRSGSLVVHVRQASALPDLTAAVESAAYRIAVEAMTNAVRHADGHCCWVSIGVDGDRLRVVVTDDGTGTPDGPPGIGLASMRERAEELGGSCMVAFVSGNGTRVAAEVPVVAR